MGNGENPKRYDLEERTESFAKRVRTFIKTLPRTVTNLDDARQLGRASGSIAANYLEANEAISRKDFYHPAAHCEERGEGDPPVSETARQRL